MSKGKNRGISDDQVDQIAAKINNLSLPDVIRVVSALCSEAGIPFVMSHLQNDATGEFSTPIREMSTKKEGFDLRFTSHGFPPEDVDAFISSLTNASEVSRIVASSNSAAVEPIKEAADADESDETDGSSDGSVGREYLKRIFEIRGAQGEAAFSKMLEGFVIYKCRVAVVEHYSKLISLGAFN